LRHTRSGFKGTTD